MKFYYKIWVSTFIKIKEAQNCNDQPGIVMAMTAIIIANFCNYLFLCIFSILAFKININIPDLIGFGSKFIYITSTILIFLLPNYFLLIFNNKHERLLERYKDDINKNLGVYYFWGSVLLVILLIVTTYIFPQYYGLRQNPGT